MFQVDIWTHVQKNAWLYHTWQTRASIVGFPVIPIQFGLMVRRKNNRQTTASKHAWCWYNTLLTAGNPSLCNWRAITEILLNTSPIKVIIAWKIWNANQLEDFSSSFPHQLFVSLTVTLSVELPRPLNLEMLYYRLCLDFKDINLYDSMKLWNYKNTYE